MTVLPKRLHCFKGLRGEKGFLEENTLNIFKWVYQILTSHEGLRFCMFNRLVVIEIFSSGKLFYKLKSILTQSLVNSRNTGRDRKFLGWDSQASGSVSLQVFGDWIADAHPALCTEELVLGALSATCLWDFPGPGGTPFHPAHSPPTVAGLFPLTASTSLSGGISRNLISEKYSQFTK